MYALILSLAIAAPGDVPGHVQTFLDTNGLKLVETCQALKRFILMKSSSIPRCKVDEAKDIFEVLPREDDPDCETHYTLFERSSGRWVCQCNEGSRHSEMIVVETHDRQEMNNLRFPCQKRCYPTLLKRLIKNKGERVVITYKEVRPDSAYKVHESLLDVCPHALRR